MSINRDMESYELYKNAGIRTTSGAMKPNWVKQCEIDVAIYDNSETFVSASARYKDSSHTGLTYYKDLKAGKYKLIQSGKEYLIQGANPSGRLTILTLKAVDTDV